jgi:hypothetical protein
MIERFEDTGGGIFAPIVGPIKNIANGIVKLGEMCGLLVEVFISIMKLIPNIFRPDKLLNDIIYGTTMGINSLISSLMEKINSIGTSDKSQTDKNNGTGGIFGIDNSSKAICTKPTWINLIILVLCPPLSLYLHLGKSGISGIGPWFYAIFMVLICSGMTYYMYYFPGFLFAALHSLC